MKFRFNHMVLVTVAIVFIVISENAKNVQPNPVANNQSNPANNATLTKLIPVPKIRQQVISPVYRNNNCEVGYTKTSTGDCKPIFQDE